MQKYIMAKVIYILGVLTSCLVLSLNTGCASGGFKLTREYARFVNSQHIIVRIILYILTIVVFAVTMLVDMVIFNTMDFWNGRVAAGSYNFNKDNKFYFVKHDFLPGTKLRHTSIRIEDAHQKLLQEVVLSETTTGQIEVFIDGRLRTKVDNISEYPLLSVYDAQGQIIQKDQSLFDTLVFKEKLNERVISLAR